MTIVFLGIYWLVMAILSWFGCPYIVRRKYREETWCKDFQRDIALPHLILGGGFILMGLKYPDFYDQNAFQFCIGLIVIGAVAFVLTFKVRNKYDL